MVHWFNNSVFRIRDVCHTQSSTGATPVRWKQSSMGVLICKTIALFLCVSSDCFIELQVFHQVAWTSIIYTKKNGYHQFKKRQRKSRTDTAHVCASLPVCPYRIDRTAGLIRKLSSELSYFCSVKSSTHVFQRLVCKVLQKCSENIHPSCCLATITKL